jgi:hypothetical protein
MPRPSGFVDPTSVWGPDGVVRAQSHLANTLGLPEDAVMVLTKIGLPRESDFFAAEQPKLVGMAFRPGRFCRVGTDEFNAVCVDTSNGEVHMLSGSGAQPDRFINSTLREFVDFLGRVTLGLREFRGLTEPEADAGVAALKRQLLDRDPRAFADEENWWSVIFEQMEDRLL